MKMEKAIFITNPANLKYYKPGFSRIYFGSEFCQTLIPTVESLERALDFARSKNLEFSFVTPFVTESGLYCLEEIFGFLESRVENCEVIVNDWGVLEVLSRRYKGFVLSLGRLLTRQGRDPAMGRVLKKQLPPLIV